MERRQFLQNSVLAAGFISQLLPGHVFGQTTDFWSQPRTLWLRRHATGEQVKATYFADGKIIPNEYRRLCILLRDVRANQAVEMSLVLLDILTGMQGWLLANGINVPLDTNSGYRNSHTNATTEGASKNSRHVMGQAWDGNVRHVTTESLAKCAIYLRGGGVGIYQQKDFLHVDSGRLRLWRG